MENNTAIKTIKIGTRGSKLALWQANAVADKLQAAGLDTEIVIISTKGDQILDKSLDKLGSKGVFTEELEVGLREGSIEIAVHSAKDVQSSIPEDLELVAFMEREQVNDVILSFNPDFKLERDSKVVIGTSSTRRKALLRKYYPNVTTAESRGNLQTRLQKLKDGQFDALMLAYAGVFRMGYDDLIVHTFPENEFVPAAGQGSVAVECARNLDPELKQQLKDALDHAETHVCLVAERAFLRTMEGGCSIPSFALATLTAEGKVSIQGGLVSLDGQQHLYDKFEGDQAEAESLGVKLAETILGRGGDQILKDIRAERGE
ncbi:MULTISPECIES: hydroxymethylbilane synthase [Pontibacter]|uniref:Porphobilinogen deaminase n=1 Tax=Pontibacter lucknowensis TaxID=1077936 RepID=A0A1N6TMP5_9BACT|nr:MULTISPECIES: hydroxymethylbilane synthase [Pontibacter]EJF11847.1 porphobilinogen deaminase [Pontibacter sp. BAB1700]SIQ54638.1 hydroxymethylbilane synthase [Pontibacter lucknowensis]